MQRWEYYYVVFQQHREIYRARYVNEREELRDWKDGPGMVSVLDHLGSEGWEAVSVLREDPADKDLKRYVLLKRLLS